MSRLLATFLLSMTVLLAPPAGMAQQKLTENTFTATPGTAPPAATLADIAWYAGHWRGTALGGLSEEIWSEPLGGAMIGLYRLLKDGKPVFYELMSITETEGTLLFQVKHFNTDLTGWEEKDRTVDFPLVAAETDAMHFEGLSIHRDGDDAVTIYLAIRKKDGSYREEAFRYSRRGR